MAKGFKSGVGGMLVNFKVVSGTSAPELPMENTIWVNTDADMSGWVFSVEAPANPEEGLVWIKVGNVDTFAFNALRRNGIVLCPMYAKQYIGSEWVTKTASIYQNGAWAEIITILKLYDNGDTFDAITGGWKKYGGGSFGESWLHVMVASDMKGVQFWTLNSVDITGYSKLNAKVTDFSRRCYIGVNNTLPKDRYWNTDGFSNNTDCEAIANISENGTVTVDISELTGLFYIWIGEQGQNVENATGCNITEVWLSN